MKRIPIIAILLATVSIALASKSPRRIVYPVTLDAVGDFIEDLGFTHDIVTTTGATGEIVRRIAMDIRGENGTYSVGVELFGDIDVLYIYIENYLDLPLENPATVPMLTYLMNQNWRMTFGRLEWNMSSGELRFSHTLPVDDGISAEVFGAYLKSIIDIADEKFPEYLITLENLIDF
ncbi:MAG TPA: YbjN domain-containing protein [candidate division Zixibacteria bacterium]|nr:YbjN domain-containing protein [candidate division Zixibacteria bacterium]